MLTPFTPWYLCLQPAPSQPPTPIPTHAPKPAPSLTAASLAFTPTALASHAAAPQVGGAATAVVVPQSIISCRKTPASANVTFES